MHEIQCLLLLLNRVPSNLVLQCADLTLTAKGDRPRMHVEPGGDELRHKPLLDGGTCFERKEELGAMLSIDKTAFDQFEAPQDE
jgi:hypothetical protein